MAIKRRNKVERVLHEFKTGTLRSSSGSKVTSRRQAIAIALSEQRRANKHGRKKASHRKTRTRAKTRRRNKR